MNKLYLKITKLGICICTASYLCVCYIPGQNNAAVASLLPDIPDLELPELPDIPSLEDIIPNIPDLDDFLPDIGDIGDLIPDGGSLEDLISFPNPLEDLQEMIQEQIAEIGNILEGSLPDIGGDIGGILEETQGELGIPDLNKAKKTIEDKITEAEGDEDAKLAMQQNDSFNTNAVALEQSIEHEVNRTIGRAVAAAAIGEESQEQTKNNLIQLATSLELIKSLNEQVGAINEQAQTLDVTQDVMKNQIFVTKNQTNILAEMAKLHYFTYMELNNLRQVLAADLQISADLSEALDEKNRGERAKTLSNASSNLFQATQLQF